MPQPSTPTRTHGSVHAGRGYRGRGNRSDGVPGDDRPGGPPVVVGVYGRRPCTGTDLLDAYRAVRGRMCAIALDLTPAEPATTVPSCPEWTVHDLIAHNMALPAAIAAGDLPDGDLQTWLDGLVEKRRGQPVAELVAEWETLDEAVAGVLSATAVLLDDLATHEHDLRAAVGRPDHDALAADLVVPAALETLLGGLTEAQVGALVIESPEGTWTSHDAEPGWTIRTSAWEAFRAVGSRRTADELRALPGEGDVEAFIPVLDAHLPLPTTSLREP